MQVMFYSHIKPTLIHEYKELVIIEYIVKYTLTKERSFLLPK